MKTLTKIVFGAALAVMTGFSAAAQNALEDPRYGATPEARKTNLGNLNWLGDEYNSKNWDMAAHYVSVLMNDAPAAHQNIYVWGAATYKNKIARATSVAEKKILLDSLMLIYDRRVQYFGDNPRQGTAYILERKAIDYAALSPMDGEGIRKVYKEALDAAGAAVKPGFVLGYFQQLVNGYKAVEVTPEELLGAYESLQPFMASGTQEEQDSYTGLLATSGAADCGVLEELYTKELAAKPGDAALLEKAFGLMSMAGCDSEFYISVGEQLYAAAPTSNIAIRLAMLFEKREQYDKALQYLSEMIESENDPAEKANLYVRVAASELGQKRYSNAAQAARQAIALNSENGYAHMFLANAYLGGQGGCSDFNRAAVSWLAYDEFARAREALAGDTTGALEQINQQMAACRANFPSNEDIFLYGHSIGASYSVSCGWISGGTTIRAR
jgi:tetratricopeptide (TPR) repeat protein